jgi:cyclic pyranopterin phosphate synthase
MSELIDSHNRKIDYLRLSVTDKCNLRCIYCMPTEGLKLKPHRDILTYEEIKLFAACAIEQGISRIRLTGGEPLIRRDVLGLIAGLTRIPGLEDISLTTNGVLLGDFAEALVDVGLNRINVSIDSLKPDVFHQITRNGSLNKVISGVKKALEVGLEPVKINVVVLRGVNEDVSDFIKFTFDYPVHVRFIEYMPFSKEVGMEKSVSSAELQEKIEKMGTLEPADSPYGAGPARYFKMRDALGTIGFISPMSKHFCPVCNRLRLTADGKLRTCLFSDDEIDVKKVLRGEKAKEEVEKLIHQALLEKPKNHSESRRRDFQRRMSQIGG